MTVVDGFVLGAYFLLVVGISGVLMLRQRTAEDYYLGGRRVPAGLIAGSIVATQASAVSLVGGPAFVALRPDGGLRWLQYELALPLAMAALLPLVAALHRWRVLSIYEFLEFRLGRPVRVAVSVLFQVSRALATGVSLYTTALIFHVVLDVPLMWTVLAIGGVSLLYTLMGGILADIASDLLQLGVLWTGVLVGIGVLWKSGGWDALSRVDPARWQTLDLGGHGWGDGRPYGFWPMLIGGLFLYMSYYGCDQSQAQRLLTAPDARTAARALFYNGLLRYPLVLTYVVFGLLLAGWLQVQTPPWIEHVRQDPNGLVPWFVRESLPTGLRGLFLAALLAAAMSSFDSAFNSISAATFRDLQMAGFLPTHWARPRQEVWVSRCLTFLWGGFCMAFAIGLGRVPIPTVIELINMVGSLLYGPILATFVIALVLRGVGPRDVLWGIVAGLGLNGWVAVTQSGVSWLWWNVLGFGGTVLGTLLAAGWHRRPVGWATEALGSAEDRALGQRYGRGLVGAFLVILLVTGLLGYYGRRAAWAFSRLGDGETHDPVCRSEAVDLVKEEAFRVPQDGDGQKETVREALEELFGRHRLLHDEHRLGRRLVLDPPIPVLNLEGPQPKTPGLRTPEGLPKLVGTVPGLQYEDGRDGQVIPGQSGRPDVDFVVGGHRNQEGRFPGVGGLQDFPPQGVALHDGEAGSGRFPAILPVSVDQPYGPSDGQVPGDRPGRRSGPDDDDAPPGSGRNGDLPLLGFGRVIPLPHEFVFKGLKDGGLGLKEGLRLGVRHVGQFVDQRGDPGVVQGEHNVQEFPLVTGPVLVRHGEGVNATDPRLDGEPELLGRPIGQVQEDGIRRGIQDTLPEGTKIKDAQAKGLQEGLHRDAEGLRPARGFLAEDFDGLTPPDGLPEGLVGLHEGEDRPDDLAEHGAQMLGGVLDVMDFRAEAGLADAKPVDDGRDRQPDVHAEAGHVGLPHVVVQVLPDGPPGEGKVAPDGLANAEAIKSPGQVVDDGIGDRAVVLVAPVVGGDEVVTPLEDGLGQVPDPLGRDGPQVGIQQDTDRSVQEFGRFQDGPDGRSLAGQTPVDGHQGFDIVGVGPDFFRRLPGVVDRPAVGDHDEGEAVGKVGLETPDGRLEDVSDGRRRVV
jgi:SSS family transporter